MKILGPLFALAAIATLHAGNSELQKPAPKMKFWDDIVPIIKAECLVCHQGNNAKGGLDLSNPKVIMDSGIVVPGKPKESELVNRLKGINGPSMPLGFRPLEATRIQKIEQWIAEGASTAGVPTPHWSYSAPKKAAPPKVATPWLKNPIDAFVYDRLIKEKLKPSPIADKETLIRRVSLDLTGLPPAVEEVDAFLADKSSDAYEKVVDRLLASPHYGEHVGRYWLDLARYADTNGYEADRSRQAYLYRDWLFKALNDNMPFDKFTIEQLAGDLMPNPTMAQKIATGFHRNSMMNEEGGVDPDEQMYQTIVDRVNTTSTVWMASTVACTRCHDHKFDPFTQKDYYAMYAYFGNNKFDDVGDFSVGQRRYYEPSMKVPTDAQTAQIKELDEAIGKVDEQLLAAAKRSAGWTEFIESKSPNWETLKPTAFSAEGTELKLLPDNSLLATGNNPATMAYKVSLKIEKPVTGIALRALPDDSLVNKGPGRATSGNFVLSAVKVTQGGRKIAFQSSSSDFTQDGYDPSGAGFGDGPGWAIYPRYGVEHIAAFAFDKPVSGEIEVVLECLNGTYPQHTLGRFALAVTTDSIPRAESPAIAELRAKSSLTQKERATLESYLSTVWHETSGLGREKRRLQREVQMIQNAVPSAMVLLDKPGVKKAQIRDRGMYKEFTGEIASTTPHFLPAPAVSGQSRLTLAKWLISKQNPLTARVQVNRMWEMHFGRGLVETSEDFGTQGSKPSHPELLDWLAITFMEKGWDMKAMHRLMVTSATYKQASSSTKALNEKDPQNLLYARGPRFRLDAEAIRDNALKVSGLLDEKIGGPSVMPFQPAGVWNSPYSGERWSQNELYRRGVYTFWKRTSTFPSFTALDAASREECVPRRSRTNTPLQALALLNDQAMMDAARALGKKMAASPNGVESGFRRVLARKPNAAEQKRLKALFDTMMAKYQKEPEAAKKLAGDPKAAAWTMVANVLLNMDEAITKQ